jgi:hypothetical protein
METIREKTGKNMGRLGETLGMVMEKEVAEEAGSQLQGANT